MPLLTRKVDYAILVLSYLHHHADGGCAREIADKFHLSRAFVANILKELCQKGFVASHRGVKGGYALLRPAGDISLADFLDALEDQPLSLAACNQTAGRRWLHPFRRLPGQRADRRSASTAAGRASRRDARRAV